MRFIQEYLGFSVEEKKYKHREKVVPDKEYFGYTEEDYAAYIEERNKNLEEYAKLLEEKKENAKNAFEHY